MYILWTILEKEKQRTNIRAYCNILVDNCSMIILIRLKITFENYIFLSDAFASVYFVSGVKIIIYSFYIHYGTRKAFILPHFIILKVDHRTIIWPYDIKSFWYCRYYLDIFSFSFCWHMCWLHPFIITNWSLFSNVPFFLYVYCV